MTLSMVPLQDGHLEAVAAIDALARPSSWDSEQFRQEVYNPTAHFYVFCLGGVLCGYGGLRDVAGEGELLLLVVHPRLQRRGLGRRQLELLLQRADELGLNPVHLEVREDNGAAISLYRRLGFRDQGRRPRYYRDGTAALLMGRGVNGTC